MNDFGYLIYENYPQQTTGTVQSHYTAQEHCENIAQISDVPSGYEDWASFEGEGLDFSKPIYYSQDTLAKIPCISEAVSGSDGKFSSLQYFTITPQNHIDGGGFTIFTYNKNIEIEIQISDDLGNDRRKTFKKSDDNFYAFPYENLVVATIYIKEVDPYSFVKIIGYDFGGTRIIGDELLAEPPKIVYHYSLTNEELEYDTLDFKVKGTVKDWNFKTGENIIVSNSGRKFIVQSAQEGEPNTIQVSCYDEMCLLEKMTEGFVLANSTVAERIPAIIAKGVNKGIPINTVVDYGGTITFSGLCDTQTTYRECLRRMLLGNLLSLKRKADGFHIANPTSRTSPLYRKTFNEATIVGLPEVERIQPITSVHFSKHKYKVYKKDGKTEFHNDYIDMITPKVDGYYQPENIKFGEPNSNKEFIAVDDNDEQVAGSYTVRVLYSNAFNVRFQSPDLPADATHIIVMAYPFRTSYKEYDYEEQSLIDVYGENELSIKDCTFCANNSSGMAFNLFFINSFRFRIILTSLVNAKIGDSANIEFDEFNNNGDPYVCTIVKKTDRLNGLYEYEVLI